MAGAAFGLARFRSGDERLRADWRGRYGYEPVLSETFVEKERFEGPATGQRTGSKWGKHKDAGAGRGHGHRSSIKRIFVYPLDAQARERLCEGMVSPRLPVPKPEPQDWAEAEFGSVDLSDRRLNRRLLEIARDFMLVHKPKFRKRVKADQDEGSVSIFQHPNTNMDDY